MTPCASEAYWPGKAGCRGWRPARHRREQERAEPGDAILGPAVDHNEGKDQRGEKADVDRQKTKKGRKLTAMRRERDGELTARALEQPRSFFTDTHTGAERGIFPVCCEAGDR